MIRLPRFVIILALLSAVFISTAPAQERKIDSTRALDINPIDPNQELNNKINFCRQLMRDQRFEDAMAFLEVLYEQRPEHPVIVNLLKLCYDQLGYNAKSEEILSRYLLRYPEDINFRLAYAEVLASQGKLKEAAEAYDRALTLSMRDRPNVRLDGMVQSMVEHNLEDQALEFIDERRRVTGDSSLFGVERGTIMEGRKEWAAATREFYALLADTTLIGETAEKRILALLGFVDSEPVVEKLLMGKTDLFTNARALKILSSHYLKSGQFEKAFQFTVMQDSIEGFKGTTLIFYMRSCLERKLYEPALLMGDYFFRHYADVPAISQAYFMYAEALAGKEDFAGAIKMYDSIVATFPVPRDQAAALYQIGDIYLNHLNDYGRAQLYFDSVKNSYPGGVTYLNAVAALPYCFLRRGDLNQARAGFEFLNRLRLNEDLKEEVAYNLALLDLFEKQVDSAKAGFTRVMVDFPRGYFVNDALQLIMVIDDAGNSPEILYDYSNALLFEQRRMFDSAAVKLMAIADNSAGVLADVALYRLSDIGLAGGDTTAAANYADRLIERFPESYFLPYGLKRKADLLMAVGREPDRAREIYRQLLEKYPNYPFISDVRQKMRLLENPPGSA